MSALVVIPRRYSQFGSGAQPSPLADFAENGQVTRDDGAADQPGQTDDQSRGRGVRPGGSDSAAGRELTRVDLTTEAIRLARELVRILPEDGETTGLLCLMLLTDARRSARTSASGDLVALDQQDRDLWNRVAITEGTQLLEWALKTSTAGPYLVQAAIAAIHDESTSTDATDWEQILHLYSLLDHMVSNPMVKLNRAVAVAMVEGASAALILLDQLEADPALRDHYRLTSVRAHLLEMAGDPVAARDAYRAAARATLSSPERWYLERRAARV
jgi:predicted RNA polymerase sigma factor